MRILGVDCGSRVSGCGIVDVHRSEYSFVGCHTIRTNVRDSLPHRLQTMHRALAGMIRDHTPDVAAFENVFHAENALSALRLGHARGVLMFTAVEAALPVYEYSPLEVKSAVTGYGRADKSQVQRMVCSLLRLTEPPQSYDASDALAVAICHAQTYRYARATATQ